MTSVNTSYRIDFLLGTIGRVILFLVQISIWHALLQGQSSETNVGPISTNDMYNYMLISSILSIIVSNNVIYVIDERIKTGQIATDLLKPMNYRGILFYGMIGENFYRIIFEIIPIVILSIMLFDVRIPSILYLILFVIAAINGVLIKFLIAYTLGLLGFWVNSIWHFSRLLEDVIKIFSGSWIPLWFFSGLFQTIVSLLPFKLIFYVPIMIYMEKITLSSVAMSLFEQLVWIVVLYVLSLLIWKLGIKKLSIQGG
ncbi:ABC transporter permease [Paenibacillus glucanolyticus]|uniref:ABC transporter permease n=1 Tax=Paenibacillus glucanolyticus TaxID=59843 RepID=UPI0034CE2CAA